MGKLIFITGGARSGKSRHAVELAKQSAGQVSFVATCLPKDDEMKARVEKHRESRPADWQTIEQEMEVAPAIKKLSEDRSAVIVDCITMLVSNLLLAGKTEEQILTEIQAIAESLRALKATTIVVSNEVGSGIVPDSELGRNFRDVAGKANQVLAEDADEAYLMVSGIPVRIKE